MSSLWELLAYDEVALRLADSLHDGTNVDVLQGPPGVGKSFLARGVGVMWEQAGGRTIVAEGDLLHSDVTFYTLGSALTVLSSGWRGLSGIGSDTALATERLAGTAGIISATVRTLMQMRPTRRRARAMYLGDAEQGILFDIQNHASGRPVLLIADNLHWWDASSLELLGRLREQRMRESFDFLYDMRVLAVQTIEPFQPVAHRVVRDELLAAHGADVVELPRVPRERFEDVLVALGATPPPSPVADAVFSLTGGHLALARRCATRIAEGDGEEFVAAKESDDFVTDLLSRRLRALGAIGTEAVQLLEIAAVLGLRFRRDEVTCAWNGDETETSRLLRFLRDQDVIELAGNAGWFVHELFQRHFLSTGALDRVAIHERLSACLRVLSPAEYEIRSQNAMRAERHEEAAALAIQALLARLRDGRSVDDLPQSVTTAISDGGLDEVAETLSTAMAHFGRDEFSQCLRVLRTLPHKMPKPVLAEADYLRATCLASTRSNVDRAASREILDGWSGLEDDEPELGVRMMVLHLYGLAMLTDKEPARELERRIKSVLRERIGFDPAAEDAMYTLDRCSSAINEPETALLRTGDAVDHYRPVGDGVVRRPLEYFRCLVNHAAECVVSARYEDAQRVSRELEALVADYDHETFPRLDEPRTTSLLAAFRLGQVEAVDAVARQRQINDDHRRPQDPFYMGNALAVYLALAGEFAEALSIYDRLLVELETRRNPDPSMEYLLRANRCSTRFVAGDRDDVLARWDELDEVVRRIPYVIAPVLIRRHELLREVIDAGTEMSPPDFDQCLIAGRRPEFGPPWDELGRGFRTPEVEWWH